MEQLIIAVKAAVEDYFTAVGLDINLDEMTPSELQEFFNNPPEAVDQDTLQKIVESTVILNQGTDQEARELGSAFTLGFVNASAGRAIYETFQQIPWGQVGDEVAGAFKEALGWVGKLFGGGKDDVVEEGFAGPLRGDTLPPHLVGPDAGSQFRTDAGTGRITQEGASPEFTPKEITGGVVGATAAAEQTGDMIPDFLQGELEIFGIKIPSPFGVEEDNVWEPEGWGPTPSGPGVMSPGGVFEDLVGPTGGVPDLILKELYFDGISEQSAFDKLTNWLGGKSVLTLDADGRSLVQALQAKQNMLGEMQIFNLSLEGEAGDIGRNIVRNFLQENWHRVPEIANAIETGFGGGVPTLDQAIDAYIEKMAKQSPYFIVAQDLNKITVDGQTEDQMSFIGITASFDGTPFGTVQSLNDLFSGGKIGHFNLTNLLESASPEQVELWQQQLYTWGFMTSEPNSWGIADEQTLSGINKWHTMVINEGLSFKRQGKDISEDGSPLADSVQNQAVLRQMGQLGQAGTRDSIIRQSVIEQAASEVEQYLNNTGRILPAGSQQMLNNGLKTVLNNMSTGTQERAFGQGGTQSERALAEAMLSEYYKNEDWGSLLEFGNSDTDKEYLQYALKAGALSPAELDALQKGILDPASLRGNTERQKDVAVSVLLGFLREAGAGNVQGVSGLAGASIEQIASAIRKYMHTTGASQYRMNPLSEQDLLVMAHNVQNSMNKKVFDNNSPLAQSVARSGIQEMGLEGGTAGYEYRQLVDALNSIRPGPQGLGVRNV